MADRRLLTDEERQALFGIPFDADGLAQSAVPEGWRLLPCHSALSVLQCPYMLRRSTPA
jgi:hypothetical protein